MKTEYTIKEILDKAKAPDIVPVPFGGDEIKSPELEPDISEDEVSEDECID